MKIRWLPLPGILIGCALAAGFLARSPEPAFAAVFEVDRLDDANVSTCSAAANDCTLRGAITKTNTTAAADEISLVNLGSPGVPATINVATPLPAVAFPLTMNGLASQGGFVRLNYTGMQTQLADGLRINSSSTHIFGMVLNSFGGDGIEVSGEVTNVSIIANRIGVNHTATAAQGNAGAGVHVTNGANGVLIQNNVIGGNLTGIETSGDPDTAGSVVVQGNFIGTNSAGADLGNPFEGIRLFTNENVIGGNSAEERNVISNSQTGISINDSEDNVVQGNYIGTNAAGTTALPNAVAGVRLFNASNSIIGGELPGEGNLISGNEDDGVRVEGTGDGNWIAGNYIGTNAAGTGAIPNGRHGIFLDEADSTSVGGGGSPPGPCNNGCNVISGNGGSGVFGLEGGPHSIFGNRIGTNAAGTAAIPNFSGVRLVAAIQNSVNGNLVSGNAAAGIDLDEGANANVIRANYIGLTPARDDLGNGSEGIMIQDSANNTIGGNNLENLISNNRTGIRIRGADATGNLVFGNFVTENAESGILLAAPQNIIGGTEGVNPELCSGACNVISGNGSHGITITTSPFAAEPGPLGGPPSPANNNQILGNHIGTDQMGFLAVPNGGVGVLIDGGAGNSIGGEAAGSGNVVSGNSNEGIHIRGETAVANRILRNKIGTNANGSTALPNDSEGIVITDSPQTVIGSPGGGNLISGNGAAGIYLQGPAPSSSGTVIQANRIGTNATGTSALPNDGNGVTVQDLAHFTRIGGPGNGEGNLMSGNLADGIEISDAAEATISGNLIGTTASGDQPLGNGQSGIALNGDDAQNNLVGGTEQGEGNVIAFNGQYGVRSHRESSENPIIGNSIHSNDLLGIELEFDVMNGLPVNANDPGDGDASPAIANNGQNYPLLSSATSGGGNTAIEGSLNSNANRQYRVEFFANDECDQFGHGEGEQFLGAFNVTTNGSGNVSFLATGNFQLAVGMEITTAATDLSTGDTSEFSACEPVVAGTPATPTPTATGQTPTPTQSATPTGTATPPGLTGTPTPTPTPTSTREHIWGDNNCSSLVDPVDGLLALRHDAGLPTNTGGCPAMGATVEVGGQEFEWGDIDCNGAVDPVDGLKLLRHDSGLSVSQPEGCPEIGGAVAVGQAAETSSLWRRHHVHLTDAT